MEWNGMALNEKELSRLRGIEARQESSAAQLEAAR